MISTFNSTTTSSGEFTQENTADSFRRKVSIASAVSVAGLEALLEPFVSDVSDSEPTAGMVVESLQQEVLSLQLQLQKEKDEEVRKMQEYALANGFDITVDEKKEEPKYQRFVVTKEMLDE